MKRIFRVTNNPDRLKLLRRSVKYAGLCLLISILLVVGPVDAAPTLRLAVAPFAGEPGAGVRSPLSIANALATRLSRGGLERLLSPGDFVAASVFEPRASEVRRWAYNSAVDAIVVGRVFPKNGAGKKGPRIVETVIRSGHSGAEISRHDVVVPGDGDVARSVETLAIAILDGLGHVEPGVYESGSATPAPSVSAHAVTNRPADAGRGTRVGGLDVAFSDSKFRSDTPIEIKADEAEIIDRDEGRHLIFRRNVWVRQDSVTLRSDRLEAFYAKGESQPRELIAEGNVKVDQHDRHAKCHRAIYLRDENRLTCIGRAELVQGCDIIRGDSIEFDLAGDQARVQGAASIVIQPEDAAPSACTDRRESM